MTNLFRIFILISVSIVCISTSVFGEDIDVERARICAKGAAQAGRPPPAEWLRLRKIVFKLSGVDFKLYHAEYETDHIIPRCLDGSNTLDNLQLQKWPRARIKDVEEAVTCHEYCIGFITLIEARSRFKRD